MYVGRGRRLQDVAGNYLLVSFLTKSFGSSDNLDSGNAKSNRVEGRIKIHRNNVGPPYGDCRNGHPLNAPAL